MANSLLYKLHSHNIVPGVEVDKNRFREVYKSKYGKVRIYKVSIALPFGLVDLLPTSLANLDIRKND